jgi:hypothetical protein
MDGESVRALAAAVMWAGGTSTERAKKPVRDFLPVADDLLKRSYQLGSPVASESVDVVLIDPLPFAAVRFREWLSRQPEDVRSLYRDVFTPPVS